MMKHIIWTVLIGVGGVLVLCTTAGCSADRTAGRLIEPAYRHSDSGLAADDTAALNHDHSHSPMRLFFDPVPTFSDATAVAGVEGQLRPDQP